MRIINVNSLKDKEQIKELIAKTNPPNSQQQIDIWLDFNLGTDVFNAWIAYKEDEAIGLIVCEIVEPFNPKVFIAFNYFKVATKGNDELLKKVEDWAKERDMHKLVFHTKHNPNTFIKKYDWKLTKTILEKEI